MSLKSNDSLGDESRATAAGVAHREGKQAEAGVAPAPLQDRRNCGECLWATQDIEKLGPDGVCPRCGTDYGPSP